MGNGADSAARTVRARAGQVIEKQREKMRRNLGSAMDGSDPEGVHDMRVASRRLRAALAAFEPWLERRPTAQVARSLRRLTRALGRVRELDVLRLRLAQLASRAAPERKLAIEIVDSRVARARLRARAKMIQRFAAIDLDGLDAQLRALSGAPPAWAMEGTDAAGRDAGVPWSAAGTDAGDDEDVRALLDHLRPEIVDAARRVAGARIPGDVGSREAAEALHEVRIRAKKLRYQLEIVEPYYGAAAERVLATLKGLQESLGEYHDDAVLDEVLTETITRQAERARPLLVAELRRLRSARRAALRRDERACRGAIEALRTGRFGEQVAAATTTPVAPPRARARGAAASAARDASASDGGDARGEVASPGSPASPRTRAAGGAGYAGEPIERTPSPADVAAEPASPWPAARAHADED